MLSAAWLAASPAAAHEVTAPADFGAYPTTRLTSRVYVIHGPQSLPSRRTGGFMNNPAFVVAPAGVVVIDPGSSRRIGRALLARIRAVTAKPVLAVFNTHVHGDHWLGNQAIREAWPGVPIYAHRRMIERLAGGEGEAWRERLDRMTQGALADTLVVGPNRGLAGGEALEIGGLRFRIHHTGRAHTDHDLMIEVPAEHTLFLGDIVTRERVPSSDVPADADFAGQMDAIRAALALPARWFVPGHGTSGGPEVARASLDFLTTLHATVRRLYGQGLADYEMVPEVRKALHRYRHWHNFDTELGRVVSHVYLQVEAESF